jgi:acetyl-CoA synthetase
MTTITAPRDAFSKARRLLLSERTDPAAASAAFQWPALERFNWATHWFDEFAEGNRQSALRIVSDAGVESVSFADMADRSRRVATYLRAAGVNRGDRVLVMLTNVVPLWETMSARSSYRPRLSLRASTSPIESSAAASGTW